MFLAPAISHNANNHKGDGSMPYDINAIRQNIKKAVSGKFTDPDEFRPDKAKDNAELKYRFFILPPLKNGDILKTGTVTQSMDNFFLTNGQHWVNERPHACPRVWDGSDCAICQYGFDLLKECKEQRLGDDRKKQIVQQWMPNTYYMVNIFFTNSKCNPEDLRGKVKFYNAPKTCLDKWMATLMKDDKGDDEDPNAFGVFFDELAAFCFELNVTKDGRSNGYKTSAFVKNGGVPVPMIMNPDRTPNMAQIKNLLQSRINLFTKVEMPDVAKISRLANTMISGDDEGDRPSGGFDTDESSEPAAPPAAQTQKKTTEKASTVTEAKKADKPVQARSEAKKQTGKAAPPVDDDDDIASQLAADSLSDEAPLTDTDDAGSSDDTSASVAKNTSSDDDIGGDDIDSLLSQLDD